MSNLYLTTDAATGSKNYSGFFYGNIKISTQKTLYSRDYSDGRKMGLLWVATGNAFQVGINYSQTDEAGKANYQINVNGTLTTALDNDLQDTGTYFFNDGDMETINTDIKLDATATKYVIVTGEIYEENDNTGFTFWTRFNSGENYVTVELRTLEFDAPV